MIRKGGTATYQRPRPSNASPRIFTRLAMLMSLTIRGLMPTVRLDKVSLSFGLKPLLDHVDLQIRRGERVCLLGRNGEGKSSLLQLITRQIVPDAGEVWVRPGARVAGLAQEVSPASDASVHEVIMSGFGTVAADREWADGLQGAAGVT